MRTLIFVPLLAMLALFSASSASAGTGTSYSALASCPDQAARPSRLPAGEPTQTVMDKTSTEAAFRLLREYLEFHGQAQAYVGARAALMPWSELATRAN